MGRGADRKRRNNENRRLRGETWSEIRNGNRAAWCKDFALPRGVVAAAVPQLSADLRGGGVCKRARLYDDAALLRGQDAAALPPLSAGLLGVEAERCTTRTVWAQPQHSLASVQVDDGGGVGEVAEPPNAGRFGEEYAVAWLRYWHALATVRWLNEADEQHADHDIEILAAGETQWRHVEVKTRWSGCDPRVNQMSDRQRDRLLDPNDSYMLLVVGDAHRLFELPAAPPRVRLYEPPQNGVCVEGITAYKGGHCSKLRLSPCQLPSLGEGDAFAAKVAAQRQLADTKAIRVEGMPGCGWTGVYIAAGENDGWPRFESDDGKHLGYSKHRKKWVLAPALDPAGETRYAVTNPPEQSEHELLLGASDWVFYKEVDGVKKRWNTIPLVLGKLCDGAAVTKETERLAAAATVKRAAAQAATHHQLKGREVGIVGRPSTMPHR